LRIRKCAPVFRRGYRGGRPQRLGRIHDGQPLQSFGINPGGYVGFYNPTSRKDEVFSLRGDKTAKRRMEIKSKAQLARRSMRYKLGCECMKKVRNAAPRDAPARDRRVRAAAMRPLRCALVVEMIDQSQSRRGTQAGPAPHGTPDSRRGRR
jgi:hypothetical protein